MAEIRRMMELIGIARDEARRVDQFGRWAIEAHQLPQLRSRRPFDDRPRLDLLHVIEEQIDKVVSKAARGIGSGGHRTADSMARAFGRHSHGLDVSSRAG